MSTGEIIVTDHFSNFAAYDLDLSAPEWLIADAGLSAVDSLRIVGFAEVHSVEWQVDECMDGTTEVGTARFRAKAQLARAADDDGAVVATAEAPFQASGRVELGNESFEMDKPNHFELQ